MLTCCILAALVFKTAQAAVGTPVSPGSLKDYQKKALELTNKLRAKHQAPPLQYDKEVSEMIKSNVCAAMLQKSHNIVGCPQLLKDAAECAKHYMQVGDIDHSCPHAVPKRHGENLALFQGNPSVPDVVQNSVQAWYDEKKDYNYDDPQKQTGVTGHFTQLVWKSSKWVGMDALKTADNRIYVVALYDPPGNFLQPPSGPGGQYGLYKKNVLREGGPGGGSAAPYVNQILQSI